MKKSLLFAVCLLFSALYPAQREISVNCLVNGTLFSIIKGDISDYGRYVDLIVVGATQQLRLDNTARTKECVDVGALFGAGEIYTLPKEFDCDSDDYTGTPCSIADTKVREKAEKKIMDCPVVRIVEPFIAYGKFPARYGKTHRYYVRKKTKQNNFKSFMDYDFYGQDAFRQANRDLRMCYRVLLNQCTFFMHEQKIIAINALGGDVGLCRKQAAKYAFQTITQFLANDENEDKYATVMLFIKKHSEFEVYQKLVAEYVQKK